MLLVHSDYVFFERSTAGFSKDTLEKVSSPPSGTATHILSFTMAHGFSSAFGPACGQATATKLKLEHFYKKAVEDAVERNTRCVLGNAPCPERRRI